MYTYDDFVHSSKVRHLGTGKVYDIVHVETDVPYLVVKDRHGNKYTLRADLAEPMDVQRVKA